MVGVYNMSVSESTGYNSALEGAYRAVQGSTGQYRAYRTASVYQPCKERVSVEQGHSVHITELYKLPTKFGADLRSMGPTHTCTCGCTIFRVACSFEDNEIAFYFLDAECLSCGNLVIVPTLEDKLSDEGTLV